MASGPAGSRRSLLAWIEERFNLTEIFSFLTSFGLFPAELDTRRPLREAIDEALARPLPSYARWPRILGILSLLLFLFLGLTGAMLAFYYQPTVSEAFSSVTTLVRDVSFGWFVHQVHRWGALLFLLILMIRIWRFYAQGMYKAPREALWVIAVLTFLVASHADLTGRLLPWDARGYWTTVRGLEVIYALPVLGPIFAFLIGGTNVDSLVLTRFYFLHVFMLPALLIVLFYLNFSGVRRVGLSALPGETRGGRSVYVVYLCNLTILAVLVLGCLITFATLLPEPFGQAADPFNTPPGARPPWYLLASHSVLESFPAWVPRGVRGLAVEAILAISILLPFIDRSPGRSGRDRRLALVVGAAVIVLWAMLTFFGWRLEGRP
ncbi:MAG TPA: cytochrome b N-terminal domain-containing protein [Candidatus Polarisedimenticolia bacterium]|nr:cytochrome b N-terminal domain-containing protein [Candidatus Polarisedimenticolia bacterium]